MSKATQLIPAVAGQMAVFFYDDDAVISFDLRPVVAWKHEFFGMEHVTTPILAGENFEGSTLIVVDDCCMDELGNTRKIKEVYEAKKAQNELSSNKREMVCSPLLDKYLK
jgi:hypothetical protein